MTTNLTNLERAALRGIVDSEYQDAATDADRIDHEIWSWDVWSTGDAATIDDASRGGVIASLVKKDYVSTNYDPRFPEEDTIAITAAGLAALRGIEEDEYDNHNDEPPSCPSCDAILSPHAVECGCGFARFPEDGWVHTPDGYVRRDVTNPNASRDIAAADALINELKNRSKGGE